MQRPLEKYVLFWRLSHQSMLFFIFPPAGENPQIQHSNMPREYIKKFFPKRKCFVFERPTNNIILLQHLEGVTENQLESSFQAQSQNFCNYIFTAAKSKILREEIIVTGNRKSPLLQHVLLHFTSCDEAITVLRVCQ